MNNLFRRLLFFTGICPVIELGVILFPFYYLLCFLNFLQWKRFALTIWIIDELGEEFLCRLLDTSMCASYRNNLFLPSFLFNHHCPFYHIIWQRNKYFFFSLKEKMFKSLVSFLCVGPKIYSLYIFWYVCTEWTV